MPEILRTRGRGQASKERKKCAYCGNEANAKGIASHERACKRKKEDLEKTLEFLASQREELLDEATRAALEATTRALAKMNSNLEGNQIVTAGGAENDSDTVHIDSGILENGLTPQTTVANQPIAHPAEPPPTDPRTGEIIVDAVKIIYHPNSGRDEEVKSLHELRNEMKMEQPVEKEPWLPFETRGDYEYAEIALAASLSVQQNNALISLIHRLIGGESNFTIRNNTELQEKWKQASLKLTDFKEKEFEVPYKTETRTFKVYYRPIWDWILDLLRDARLVSHINWDAQRLYKYNESSKSYVRYYDEPWTAERFWEVQSEFSDKETKPISIIFYADKNKLSSFGTQKGYPVVVRCANLPVNIRNSDGIGGGIVLAWLPIVPENATDSGKTSFANFKASVWHRAVGIILRSIKNKSKIGHWVKCGDGITRHVCPHISIISADHEEQGIIALNRGPKGLKACNVCNHPTAKLSNLLINHSLRTAEDSEAYYKLIKSFSTKKSKEFIMKLHGMRPVKSAFWNIGHTDVHRAISWDRLHAYHSGLFGSHIWPVFKSYFEKLGRDVQGKIDKRLSLFPRWRGLYHFDSAINLTFNDGRKHEDLSKQLLYVIHDIFDRNKHIGGYNFVRLFQEYLKLDVYMSFDLHTEDTIIATEKVLRAFGELLLNYVSLTEGTSSKNWNFLKAHSHKHACDDIKAKGVTRNFNTKPNEKLHGPLRDIYHDRTNFRDVAPQILRVSHQNLVSTFIRGQLNSLDKKNGVHDTDTDSDNEDGESGPVETNKLSQTMNLPRSDKFVLGAQQKPSTIAQLEVDKKDDVAFKDFRKKLIVHLNNFFGVFNIPLPGGKYLRLTAEHLIMEFRFMKVNYESLVTWSVITDYLRCTPNFFRKPRYDCILFNAGKKKCFGRLIFIFAIWIQNTAYPIALVQGLDAYLGPTRLRDRELGFTRIGAKPRSAAEFIPAVSIIRGAVIVPVFEDGKENEFLVMDTIDGDMLLRCQDLKNESTSNDTQNV